MQASAPVRNHKTDKFFANSAWLACTRRRFGSYEHQVKELVAEDEETADYVADLRETWDDNIPFDDDPDPDLNDDPETLLFTSVPCRPCNALAPTCHSPESR